MRSKERKNAGEPAFCKKPDSPAPPPAKTLIWLAVRTALFWAQGSMPFRQNPGTRTDQHLTATKHLGVFGEGPGEGVFAKTPSSETLVRFLPKEVRDVSVQLQSDE